MKRAATVGDWVKFIDADGRSVYCRVTGLELDERSRIMAILEVQSGRKKGYVGGFPAVAIKWNGRIFVADARKEAQTMFKIHNPNYSVQQIEDLEPRRVRFQAGRLQDLRRQLGWQPEGR